MKLADRVCVITGGARGIGEAIAAAFHRRGRGRRHPRSRPAPPRTSTAARLGGTAIPVRRQLPAIGRKRRSTPVLYAHGRIDVLVQQRRHRAGRARRRPSRMTDWDTSIGVMQTGVFLCSQIVGRHMLERGHGTIVNTSSMNAWEAFPMRLAYCAAKAAVVAMTQVLAIEWADRGIRVNAVAPGVTRTALVAEGDRRRRHRRRRLPRAHADAPVRRARRDRPRGAVPRLRRGLVVRHRHDAVRRRRLERDGVDLQGGCGTYAPPCAIKPRSRARSATEQQMTSRIS